MEYSVFIFIFHILNHSNMVLLILFHWFVFVFQSLSQVLLFVTSWTTICQTSLSYAISLRLLKFVTSPTWWTWVWVNSGSWWWTGRPGVLQFMGSQDLDTTERLSWTESVIPSNHLILCCPLLLLPSILPSIKVCSNESVRHIRWPKYWGFSFSISPSNEYSGLISFMTGCVDLLAVQILSCECKN